MELTILNTKLEAVRLIDTYESFIWTDRYYAYGDFELYTSVQTGMFDYIRQDYYIRNKSSDHVMIIEKIQITSDVEEGNHITVTGRSLESILDRRIIWGQKTISGNLQNGIKTLLNENVISPTDPNRKVSNFIFEESTDKYITSLKIEAQYTGDNLYEVIQKICEENNIGFKITINDSNQFVFKLYNGTDRSYEQNDVPYVLFSPKFENIINSNYIESKAALKNITLIGGEGEGAERRYTTFGSGVGLERRELFTDARDISSDVGDDKKLSDAEYISQLQQRGKEKLAENTRITSFEGETETTIMFQYGKDFFNGDIVQVANEYSHETRTRILEVVISEDENGVSVYPTFKSTSDSYNMKIQTKTVTPTIDEQIIVPDKGCKYLEKIIVKPIPCTLIENVEGGRTATIGDSTGSFVHSSFRSVEDKYDIKAQIKTVTPSQVEQTIVPDNGYEYISKVIIKAIPYVENRNPYGGTTAAIA